MCKPIYDIHIKVYELTDEDVKNCPSEKVEKKVEKCENNHKCDKNRKPHKKISPFEEFLDFIDYVKAF